MAGRGKKLSCGYGDRLTPRRRPGEVDSLSQNTEITNLVDKVRNLNLSQLDTSKIKEIEECFKDSIKSKALLECFITQMHHVCSESDDFCYKFILSFENIFPLTIDGTNARSVLLQIVQKDHSSRENLQSTNVNRFISNVSLLGAIYQCVRISGSPISVLGPALIEYLELILLSGDEIEFKIFTVQIFINGVSLLNSYESLFKELSVGIRYTLINRNLSSLSRAWLFLALDIIEILPLKTLPPHLKSFYTSVLGDEMSELENYDKFSNLELLVKFQEKVTIVKKLPEPNQYKEENIKADVDQIREKIKLKGLFTKVDKKEVFKSRNWQEGEKLSEDVKVWGLNENGYETFGHDDRYEKDDDFYGVQMMRNNSKNSQKPGTGRPILKKTTQSPLSAPLPESSWD